MMYKAQSLLFFSWVIVAAVLPESSIAFSSTNLVRLHQQQRSQCPHRIGLQAAGATSSPTESPTTEEHANDATQKENDDDAAPQNNSSLLRLAQLSLEDYKWRSSVFKSKEADRKVEESLARMMGEDPSYVRPMDASENKIGPLGLWEKTSVNWLTNVIDEEARRAKKIVRLGGMMVRPMEASTEEGELGPLGILEGQLVSWWTSVRKSEKERSRTKTIRPKDLEDSVRGPLGDAELKAVARIREILDSEKQRAQRSKLQEGVVRPIDVPGPLGDFEMAVLDVVKAEKQRVLDRERSGARVVRPMDSTRKGPLGAMEEQAVAAVERLTFEEKERLRNVQRYLDENRPMEQDKHSLLGLVETVAVGIVRAPILLFQIASRVFELLHSESLAEHDAEILRRKKQIEEVHRKREDNW